MSPENSLRTTLRLSLLPPCSKNGGSGSTVTRRAPRAMAMRASWGLIKNGAPHSIVGATVANRGWEAGYARLGRTTDQHRLRPPVQRL